MQTTNIIERLVAAPDGSALANALEQRAEILRLSQASHDAVVTPKEPGGFTHAERAALAERMARINGDAELAGHYRACLEKAGATDVLLAIADPSQAAGSDARLDTVIRYTDLVTRNPREATRANIEQLKAAGISEPDIVRLTELLAFVNYQILRDRWSEGYRGIVMSKVIHDFTVKIPHWNPYLEPVELDKATPEQLDAMKITPSHKKISEYVLTLAHDPESLAVRSPLFNLIMHGRDGLSLAERELGAIGSSVVNRCVYCAAVHGSRYNHLTSRTDVVDEIFANGLEAELDDHSQRIFDFAVALAKSPPHLDETLLRNVGDLGLSEVEIVDLVLSVAIFGWANRLMHVLGEPLQE